MYRLRRAGLTALLALTAGFAPGCTSSEAGTQPEDAAFDALQARGAEAMGVDQYTSTHIFDALADGGRIELQRDVDDPAGVGAIRAHMAGIAEAFGSGDFTVPAFVHAQEVPGAAVMAALGERIAFEYRELPRGGELRLITTDPEALAAIHDFMAFQREEHRAGGSHVPAVDHATGHEGSGLHEMFKRLHGGGDAP